MSKMTSKGQVTTPRLPGDHIGMKPINEVYFDLAEASRREPSYSAATGTAVATGSTRAAQNLNSGILPNGSSCGLVRTFAAASA